jgi:DNA-binding transcriptional ArsR family regulator
MSIKRSDFLYNTFNSMNTSIEVQRNTIQIAKVFALLGKPSRLQILLVIGGGEACVCHIEAALGLRQASISQQLMGLRKAGLVTTHRDGRNIFYRLENPEMISVLEKAAQLIDLNPELFTAFSMKPIPNCPCPYCNPGIDPELACNKIKH